MMNELKDSQSGYFVTLTYDNESIPLAKKWNMFNVGTLDKTDLQKFHKRLRGEIMQNEEPGKRWLKQNEKGGNWSPKYRYFACGEYGSKGDRPHYHIIMYNLPHDYIEWDPLHKEYYSDYLEEIWGKGNIQIGKVEQGSCHYVAKYTIGDLIDDWDKNDPREKPFALMSRKPGIGANYVDKNIKNHYDRSQTSYALVEGNHKQRLGRYYKDKIYSDPQTKEEVNYSAREYYRKADDRLLKYCRRTGKDYYELLQKFEREQIKKVKRAQKKAKL